MLRGFGLNALSSKSDIKSAFRLLPVNLVGFNSLGFHFDGNFYLGFTLSCFYYETFSTFLHWVIQLLVSNVNILHYLDDFSFIGKPDSLDCLVALNQFKDIANYFGIPIAEEKTVLPCCGLEFFGITIDSNSMEFRLPVDKLLRIKSLLEKLLSKQKTTLKELQSLLGLLVFTARVIPMGRVFSKRLYMASRGLKSPSAHMRLTRPLKKDLKIWYEFICRFNGHAIWQDDFILSESLQLFTDSAGSVGYGVYFNGHWSIGSWLVAWQDADFTKNIVLLELFPVLVPLVLWVELFQNKHIILSSDNKGVVLTINCLAPKSEPVVNVLRHIVLQSFS